MNAGTEDHILLEGEEIDIVDNTVSAGRVDTEIAGTV